MSHAGDPNVLTPTMDRMSNEGASFRRAYANCPVCTPSRGTIFSGRHAHCGPVPGFREAYKATAPSTATVLKDQGYRTAYFGKWHCGIVHDQVPEAVRDQPGARHRTPEHLRAGFEDWFGFELINDHFNTSIYEGDNLEPTSLPGYQTDVLTDRAIDYLREYDRDTPLFMVLSVEPPHFPLEAPEKWRRFEPSSLQVRPNFVDRPEPNGGAPVPSPWEHSPIHDASNDMREHLATYYGMIENLDWNMGRLLDAVSELPRFSGEQTMVVYISDHGDFMGSHGLHDRKEHPHEECTRIPALFHWPGILPAQGAADGLFGLVDLLPTTCGLIGCDIPVWTQGTDFSPRLRGPTFNDPEWQLLEMSGSPRWCLDFVDWRAVVTERWKYAFYETGTELLFDLESDPFEGHNLAAEMPQKRDELRALLLEALRETREPFFDVLIEHGVACPMPRNVSGVDYRILWKT
jgi:arylsulfatase A-like enzyme